jgi:hypothetical protein
LADLQASYIDLSEFVEPISDSLVRSLVVPYLYLLPLDPIGPGNLPDTRYCVIHPHAYQTIQNLPALEYAFFMRVVTLYASNNVVTNSTVQIG